MRAIKPAADRPVGSSVPSGFEQSTERLLEKSMKERGGFGQSVKRETKPASVQRSFSVKRSFFKRLQVDRIVPRTLSSASSKFSRDKVRRCDPTVATRSARATEEVGDVNLRDKCSSCFSSEIAPSDGSPRRKHFFIFRRWRFGQFWIRCMNVLSSME